MTGSPLWRPYTQMQTEPPPFEAVEKYLDQIDLLLVMTVVPGNARPSSSAVRRAPTTTARIASAPQRRQRGVTSIRPHHRHVAPSASRSDNDNGPIQCRHRAMVRHLAQATEGR